MRLGQDERVIVEVKYIRKGFNSGFLAETVNGLTARTALYASRFSAPSRAVLVIILASPNSIFVEKIENLKVRLRADRPQLGERRDSLHHERFRDPWLDMPTSAKDA